MKEVIVIYSGSAKKPIVIDIKTGSTFDSESLAFNADSRELTHKNFYISSDKYLKTYRFARAENKDLFLLDSDCIFKSLNQFDFESYALFLDTNSLDKSLDVSLPLKLILPALKANKKIECCTAEERKNYIGRVVTVHCCDSDFDFGKLMTKFSSYCAVVYLAPDKSTFTATVANKTIAAPTVVCESVDDPIIKTWLSDRHPYMQKILIVDNIKGSSNKRLLPSTELLYHFDDVYQRI